MALTIKREELLKPLQLVIGVVERRQTMPILANVLLTTKDQCLYMVASDMEVELLSSVTLANISGNAFSTTVPGRKLMDICRALPTNSMITISEQGKSFSVDVGNSHFDLLTLPVEEFPRTQSQPERASFKVSQRTLLSLVRRTYFSIAENHAHIYLNGLLLDIKDGLIRAVAADGHRLSLYSIKSSTVENTIVKVIIPKKAIVEMMRLLADTDDLATVEIAKNYIRIYCNDFTLTSKLIDSKYPAYNKLVPTGGDKRIVLNSEVFKNALIRVGILSNELLRSMRLELCPNLLRLIAHNIEQEKAEEVMAIDYVGIAMDIGFNIAYLLEILATIKTAEISATFKNSKSGVIIEEVGGNEDCLYVVMPFQI